MLPGNLDLASDGFKAKLNRCWVDALVLGGATTSASDSALVVTFSGIYKVTIPSCNDYTGTDDGIIRIGTIAQGSLKLLVDLGLLYTMRHSLPVSMTQWHDIIENICALKGLKCLGLVVKRARVDAEPAVTDFQDLNS